MTPSPTAGGSAGHFPQDPEGGHQGKEHFDPQVVRLSAMGSPFLGQVPSRVRCPVLTTPASWAAPGGGMLLILGPRLGTWCILKGIIAKASVGVRLSPHQEAGRCPSWDRYASNLSIEWDDHIFPLRRSELRGRLPGIGPESSGSRLDTAPWCPASHVEVEERALTRGPARGLRPKEGGHQLPSGGCTSILVQPALGRGPVLSADMDTALEALWPARGDLGMCHLHATDRG